jgi:PadR family transcriptional regulator, regulatory protein PadR
MGDTQSDLLRSSLDLLILKALSWGPRHGYGVAEWIEHATGDALSLEEGTLYPALHRLERNEWVTTTWGISDNNRRAKFYHLTAAGQREFEQQANGWLRLSDAVSRAVTSAALPAARGPR